VAVDGVVQHPAEQLVLRPAERPLRRGVHERHAAPLVHEEQGVGGVVGDEPGEVELVAQFLLAPPRLGDVGAQDDEPLHLAPAAAVRDVDDAVVLPDAARARRFQLERRRLAGQGPLDVGADAAETVLAQHLSQGHPGQFAARAAEELLMRAVGEAVAAVAAHVGDQHRQGVGDEAELVLAAARVVGVALGGAPRGGLGARQGEQQDGDGSAAGQRRHRRRPDPQRPGRRPLRRERQRPVATGEFDLHRRHRVGAAPRPPGARAGRLACEDVLGPRLQPVEDGDSDGRVIFLPQQALHEIARTVRRVCEADELLPPPLLRLRHDAAAVNRLVDEEARLNGPFDFLDQPHFPRRLRLSGVAGPLHRLAADGFEEHVEAEGGAIPIVLRLEVHDREVFVPRRVGRVEAVVFEPVVAHARFQPRDLLRPRAPREPDAARAPGRVAQVEVPRVRPELVEGDVGVGRVQPHQPAEQGQVRVLAAQDPLVQLLRGIPQVGVVAHALGRPGRAVHLERRKHGQRQGRGEDEQRDAEARRRAGGRRVRHAAGGGRRVRGRV
jgi:hypothetical protein